MYEGLVRCAKCDRTVGVIRVDDRDDGRVQEKAVEMLRAHTCSPSHAEQVVQSIKDLGIERIREAIVERRARWVKMETAIERISNLHKPDPYGPHRCICEQLWPCETREALGDLVG